MDEIRLLIRFAATGIEVLAVLVMLTVIAVASVRTFVDALQCRVVAYNGYRTAVGKSILIGLELLVAADIIRTVAIAPTPTKVAVLFALVLIRTFLGWVMTLEVEHRWPWQSASAEADKRSDSSPGQGEDPLKR